MKTADDEFTWVDVDQEFIQGEYVNVNVNGTAKASHVVEDVWTCDSDKDCVECRTCATLSGSLQDEGEMGVEVHASISMAIPTNAILTRPITLIKYNEGREPFYDEDGDPGDLAIAMAEGLIESISSTLINVNATARSPLHTIDDFVAAFFDSRMVPLQTLARVRSNFDLLRCLRVLSEAVTEGIRETNSGGNLEGDEVGQNDILQLLARSLQRDLLGVLWILWIKTLRVLR